MDKVKFDGNIINLYSEDYEYMQNAAESEAQQAVRQTIKTPYIPSVIRGFNIMVSIADSTKIEMYHEDNIGTAVNYYGTIIEDQAGLDLISLSDYTASTVNYIYLKYYKVDASFDKLTSTIIEGSKLAIDLSDFSKEYNRHLDKWTIVAYTAAEYAGLSEENQQNLICLGSTTAQGIGVDLTVTTSTGRIQALTQIAPGSVDASHLSGIFHATQQQVDESVIYNDNYSGTPINLEEDLNELRTEVRKIKGTGDYRDSTDANLQSFDTTVNKVHTNGILSSGYNLDYIITSSGTAIQLKTGKALVDGSVVVVNEDNPIALNLAAADRTTIGDYATKTGAEAHYAGAQPAIITLDHAPIANLLVVEQATGTIYASGTHYIVDEATGIITTISGKDIVNETVDCYYDWGKARYDVVEVNSAGEFSLTAGIPDDDPELPTLSGSDILRLYVVERPVLTETIVAQNVFDVRKYVQTVRERFEINPDDYVNTEWGVNKVSYIDSSGDIDTGWANWSLITTSSGRAAVSSTSSTKIRTVIFTDEDDELWIRLKKHDVTGTITIAYEEISGSGILNEAVDINLFNNTTLENLQTFVAKGFSKGYHIVELTLNDAVELEFYGFVVGKSDMYYGITGVELGVLKTNRLDTAALNTQWEVGYEYKISDLVMVGQGIFRCAIEHTSSSNFTTDFDAAYWEVPFEDGTVTTAKFAEGAIQEIMASTITNLRNRLDASENQLLEISLQNFYQSQQTNVNANFFLETFLNEDKNDATLENSANNLVQIMDDTDWNNNWKEREGVPNFKNGFMRPPKQSYMLEIIDEYNLKGIGQISKGGISQYDTTSNCYWLMTNNGSNGIGEIVKLSHNMKDGRVEVLDRWYLNAKGSSYYWSGIDSDESYVYAVVHGDSLSTSAIYSFAINSDGTIGYSHVPNGGTIYVGLTGSITTVNGSDQITVSSTNPYRVGLRIDAIGIPAGSYITKIISSTVFEISEDATADGSPSAEFNDYYRAHPIAASGSDVGYYTDCCIWDENDIMVLVCNGTTNVNLISLAQGTLTTGTASNQTGLEKYIGGSLSKCRSITKYGNDLYTRVNDNTDTYRFIYKFDVTTDIDTNIFIKASGRWHTSRNFEPRTASGGITIGYHGDLLEIESTTNTGDFISHRSLKNALWAENQVVGEIQTTAGPTTDDNRAICFDGDYVWYSANNNNTNAVRLYRRNVSTGAETYTTVNAGNWDHISGMCWDDVGGTDYFFILGESSISTGRSITRTVLESALGGTLNFTSPSTEGSPVGDGYDFAAFQTGETQYDICTDGTYLYIINESINTIDRWNLLVTPTIETAGYITIPAAGDFWSGIAWKDNKLYLYEDQSAKLGKIHVIEDEPDGSGDWYKIHLYQSPNSGITDTYSMDFDSDNNLWLMDYASMKMFGFKTFEDPDVMQLHTFIDSNNILLTDNVACSTPIVERHFDPDAFTEWLPVDIYGNYDPNNPDHYGNIPSLRNVPDMNYCAVGYGNEGFSILHLDAFLSDKSTTGKDRYDVRKITVQHYEEGTANLFGYDSAGHAYVSSLSIERDIIVVIANSDDGINGVYNVVVDLKSGVATYLYISTHSGKIYNGTLSERNDGKGITGVSNSELNTSHTYYNYKSHAHTFTKEDASDYQGENPITFVAIGNEGGCDLLRIDWDENGNRTPVKVWNSICENDVSMGRYACWIAPSGYIFFGDYESTGNIATLQTSDTLGDSGGSPLLPVWEVNSNTHNRKLIGSNILGGDAVDIAPNSRCWKAPSGEWRHQLICGTYGAASYNWQTSIVDVENETREYIELKGSSEYSSSNVDIFEDTIYSIVEDRYSTSYPYFLGIAKKLRFDDNYASYMFNNWSGRNHYATGSYPGIRDEHRPHFVAFSSGDTGYNARVCRYSPETNILTIGSSIAGLQLFHFPQMNNSIQKSIEVTIDNPEQFQYIQNSILNGSFKINT